MIKNAIQKLVESRDLTEQEAIDALTYIMEGNATDAQIGSFITALRMKGETIEEITGCAKVMREKSEKVLHAIDYCIDTCGTGGDGTETFNISTAVAFVTAAGGVYVAKHNNRSVSSKTGSADVLESLGININLTPNQVKNCIENTGIGFMFAPTFHKSMKYAAGPRRELGIRTIFNILGPLTNPANAKGQILGVFKESLTTPLAKVLLNLNVERAMVVHGMDGMDEITTIAATKVSEVLNGEVLEYKICPEDFGLEKAVNADLRGGDAKDNAEIICDIFKGAKGPKRDIVLFNAAAALYVGKAVDSLREGIKLASEIIDSGRAMDKLNQLRQYTNSEA